MYKHQIIGTRRNETWRSRQSGEPGHIVGICTMEAVHPGPPDEDRFENFDPREDWEAVNGQVTLLNPRKKGTRDLTVKCRYWSLEEVIDAMWKATPQHEFYTRDPRRRNRKITVFSFLGKTDLFTPDPDDPGAEIPVYCGERGKLFTKSPVTGQPVPFSLQGNKLFMRVPDTGQSLRVKRKHGALCAKNGAGDWEEIECRAGDVRWIRTAGDAKDPGNLHWLDPPTQIPCPMNDCPVIPASADPVSRGQRIDC